ncbi:MAG: hypothetical protein KDD52_08095 [Bdellovibrionales bacterium]|nr:hypothetical protein [Bdellovibrionales bacterium]
MKSGRFVAALVFVGSVLLSGQSFSQVTQGHVFGFSNGETKVGSLIVRGEKATTQISIKSRGQVKSISFRLVGEGLVLDLKGERGNIIHSLNQEGDHYQDSSGIVIRYYKSYEGDDVDLIRDDCVNSYQKDPNKIGLEEFCYAKATISFSFAGQKSVVYVQDNGRAILDTGKSELYKY